MVRQTGVIESSDVVFLALAALIFQASAAGAAHSKSTHTYKTIDSLNIEADVYRAEGNDIRPAILWIHGGALISGHRGNLRAEQLQRYLNAGFVVVSIDYRLALETKPRFSAISTMPGAGSAPKARKLSRSIPRGSQSSVTRRAVI